MKETLIRAQRWGAVMLIDEVIISRCIAMIKYHAPNTADSRKIWQVMTEQFALPLNAALIDELAELFPNATGRDIKGLTKLVAKFCQQQQLQPDPKVFKRCSVFRELERAEFDQEGVTK